MEQSLSLQDLFGGLPFLDTTFKPNQFLTAVACARRFRYERLGFRFDRLEEYLIPSNALIVYSKLLNKEIYLYGSLADGSLVNQLNEQIEKIVYEFPWWKSLFGISLVFYIFDSDTIIGTSSAIKPQHIFLGSRALTSSNEIREQVLHEVVHIWAYMIEELWMFHNKEDISLFSLPSGTSEKTATGVIHAAYVARVLSDFYRKNNKDWLERSKILTEYYKSCLSLIETNQFLTRTGREIIKRLSHF